MTLEYYESNYPPRYDIAPTQTSFVVRETAGVRELAELRWGLLPKWAKSPRDGARTINARSETVALKPAYRVAFKSRPCLVVADGYYEWQKIKSGKQPFYITTKSYSPLCVRRIMGAEISNCTGHVHDSDLRTERALRHYSRPHAGNAFA